MSGRIDADLAVSSDGTLTLSGILGAVPLDLVHPAFLRNGIRGDVGFAFDTLVIRNGLPVLAEGSVTITDFFSPDLAASRIGDFRADFSTAGDTITGQVIEVDALLDLDGSITINADRTFAFIGLVAPTARAPASIANQLHFLGSPDERGRFTFRFEGQF
jgi:hypothetical protein